MKHLTLCTVILLGSLLVGVPAAQAQEATLAPAPATAVQPDTTGLDKIPHALTPAASRMNNACDLFAVELATSDGAPENREQILAKAKANEETFRQFASRYMNASQQAEYAKAFEIFKSHYEFDLSAAQVQQLPLTVETLTHMCQRHARGAGKKFDDHWKAELTREEERLAAEKKKKEEEEQQAKKAAENASKQKVLASLHKSLELIDQSLNNKFTTEAEKPKLLEQRARIEKEIQRWESKK